MDVDSVADRGQRTTSMTGLLDSPYSAEASIDRPVAAHQSRFATTSLRPPSAIRRSAVVEDPPRLIRVAVSVSIGRVESHV